MRKAFLAGVLALAMVGPAAADYSPRLEIGIARFKSALQLTPDQARHWPRVEAALRALARDNDRQEEASAGGGFVSRVGAQAGNAVSNAMGMRRLISAAQPLVKSLDQGQRQQAMTLARAMGFGSLAARFE